MSSTSSSSLSISEIIGIAVGGVLALATIIGIIISCCALCNKKKNNPSQVGAYPPPYYHPNAYGQPMNTGYYQQQQQPQWTSQPMNNVQQNPYYIQKPTY